MLVHTISYFDALGILEDSVVLAVCILDILAVGSRLTPIRFSSTCNLSTSARDVALNAR